MSESEVDNTDVEMPRLGLYTVCHRKGSGEVPVLRGKGREVDHIDVELPSEMPRASLYSLLSSQSSTAERPPSPSSNLLPAAVLSKSPPVSLSLSAELPRPNPRPPPPSKPPSVSSLRGVLDEASVDDGVHVGVVDDGADGIADGLRVGVVDDGADGIVDGLRVGIADGAEPC